MDAPLPPLFTPGTRTGITIHEILEPAHGTQITFSFQRAFKHAVKAVGITMPAKQYSLRHAFATHLLPAGYVIRAVQDLLGHAHVATTMIYTHV